MPAAALKVTSENGTSINGDEIVARVRAEARLAHECRAMALRCLAAGVAQSKAWAADMRVSERSINRWIAGTMPLPESRAKEILIRARLYLGRFALLATELELFTRRVTAGVLK